MNRIGWIFISSLWLIQGCSETVTETVRQQSIDIIVSASGELESMEKILVAPPSVNGMWQYQIKQMVAENTQVAKGQVVVSFDDKKVRERLIEKQAKLDQAHKKLENQRAKEEATQQELILVVAEKQMEYTKAERISEIVDQSLSANERRKNEIKFTIAENDLFLARKKLSYHLDTTELNIKLAQASVMRLTNKVNRFKSDVERLKVKAPMAGIVLYKADWDGEKPAVGENVQFGQPVMELAVLEKMQVKAQIDEPDSGAILPGQPVTITLGGTQELVFQGKVKSLGSVFRQKSRQDRRLILDVIIAIDKVDPKLMRPGMTVRVEVVTDTLQDVLTISQQAITIKDGKNTGTVDGVVSTQQKSISISHVIYG